MYDIGPELSAIIAKHAVHPVPDIGDCFDYAMHWESTPHSYRVTGWMCRREPPAPPGPDADPQTRMAWEIVQELRAEGKIDPPRGAGPDNVPLRFCLQHEAEYVTGSGVCGVIVRVTDVQVTRRVDWTPELLADERAMAVRRGELQEPLV
jgi:hypothetical protein